MKIRLLTAIVFLLIAITAFPQHIKRSDANLVGHVVSGGEHIPFATIMVKGTTIGTTTDETGHYQINNMPEGTYTIVANSLGFSPKEFTVTMVAGKTIEHKFELEKDVLNLDEVVITGDRNATSRRDASVIVSSITPKVFELAQATNLAEGLDFTPGLRLEYNCQNCGFSQVRMNGMEGPYSQILINGRSIFSGLAGVYGLELIPENMIDKVEVVRGGGSALYGSNAIAGTINLILKDPITNSYEFEASSGAIGVGLKDANKIGADHTAKFNTSLISSDAKTGMSLYGYYRERPAYDANGDNFSDLTSINNTTLGTRLFHRFGSRNRISLDAFRINEDRRGGNEQNTIEHMSDVSESVSHNINTGALSYDQFFREHDKLSVFVSGQQVRRDSYYGAEQSLADYGFTKDFSYNAGAQYHLHLEMSELTIGIENQGAWLKDKKLGYLDIENPEIEIIGTDTTITYLEIDSRIVADQHSNTFSAFGQYEINFEKMKITAGLRYDKYTISDNISDGDKTGNVISPRLTFKYDILTNFQARVSYSQGYRAPQIFDEDLHILTSEALKVIHVNDPDLKQETSHSFMGSLDYNQKIGSVYVGILTEGFYTVLKDAFVNEPSLSDGILTYTRINAEGGATVTGVNVELNIVPTEKLKFQGSFTFQISEYDEVQEFNEKSFFRSPNDYGYFTITYDPIKRFGVAATGTYTGSMLVPYYGNTLPEGVEGELRESNPFFDLGLKAHFNTRINGATLQIYAGIKNIFNSYQDDFDRGADRDPGYVYGPGLPRMIYAGIKIGNLIK
ncbi:MAG: TonB-dependent receptor [Salinivirgaceae bacterium]|nr:MAG: TonB-dependent receptor [Salinivirgaceae bacterium]